MGTGGGGMGSQCLIRPAFQTVWEDGKVLDDGGDVNVLNATDLCT